MTTADIGVASAADLEYLRIIGTGLVHDAMMRLGLSGSATRLKPANAFGEKHIAGPAATVRFLPDNGTDKPPTSLYDIMGRAGRGMVIVVDGQGYPGNFFGGIMARMATRAGVEAVVIDGGFRDTQEVRAYGVPLFSTQGACVAAGGGFGMQLSDEDIPVTCDGVRVRPGDIVVGDDDGVVFVPPNAFDEVMANVRDIEQVEQQMERVIAEGRPIEDLLKLTALKSSGRV